MRQDSSPGASRNCANINSMRVAVLLFGSCLPALAAGVPYLTEPALCPTRPEIAFVSGGDIRGAALWKFRPRAILLVFGDIPVSEWAEPGDFAGRLQRREAIGVGSPASDAARGARGACTGSSATGPV